MNRNELIAAIKAAEALELKQKYNKADIYFTDSGRNSRTQYKKHMEAYKATKEHNIVGFVGGNGTGKSLWMALDFKYHTTGKYPSWWEGYRFESPINAWMCAREGKALREGIQEHLFGGISDEDIGTGVIPRSDLLDDKGVLQKWSHPGAANCIGSCRIRHYDKHGIFDGWSKVEFKTYEQGWAEFQGPTRQWIGFDEEPDDPKVYAECITRLRPKDGGPVGHFRAAFTPTHGYSTVFMAFVPNGIFPINGEHVENPKKYTVKVTKDDVPKHQLPDEFINSCVAEWKITDPGNIAARLYGEAAMGTGRVYPIDESFVVIPKQAIPAYWKRAYGLDPGSANTAVIWIAQDPNTNVKYIYDEYKNGRVIYLIHAEAIKARGEWIKGGIDPHEAVKPRDTGETVQNYFEVLGLDLVSAKGDPDALRAMIRAQFDSGMLKIMDNCTGLISEIRTLHFDEKDPNKIAKGQEDHRCDAMMYDIAVFDEISRSYAEIEEEYFAEREQNKHKFDGDDGRSQITGY